jgi:tetratricopeptide (TPR) repeat protein
MALCQSTDNRILFPFVGSLLGSSYALSGRLSEALPLLDEAACVAVSIRLAVAGPLPVGLLGEAYLIAGRLDEALEEATRALELSRKHGERGFEGWARHLFGGIHLRRQSTEAAAESYNQALTIGEESGMRPLIAQCHAGLASLYRRIGKPSASDEHFTRATALYREMGMTYWREKVHEARDEIRT